MLVLTRKSNQTVVLDPRSDRVIRVTVLGIDKNGYVKLGFEADNCVSIVREELLEIPAKEVVSL
jgi:carbon storage regulator CsrA